MGDEHAGQVDKYHAAYELLVRYIEDERDHHGSNPDGVIEGILMDLSDDLYGSF